MNESKLIHHAKDWVKSYFESRDNRKFHYHNFQHTLEVVNACSILAARENLNEKETEILLLAAYFHDTGCWAGQEDLSLHEEKGVGLAAAFLKSSNHEFLIEDVSSLILATKFPPNPRTISEKIICDADLQHLSSGDFFDFSLKLKKEQEELGIFMGTKTEWFQTTLGFMRNQRYHSKAGLDLYESGKKINIQHLEDEISKMEDKKMRKAEKDELQKSKKNLPDRGVETMFKLVSKNHIQLSAIADNKANILISINSIIISIVVTVLFRQIEEFPFLIFPASLLLATNLVTIVYAILATRPKVTHGLISEKDIEDKTSNLLYFGNFHKMEYEDYEKGMKKMMSDADFLYSSIIKDVFYLGKVLSKKYNLLRKSYNVFMYGFIISSLAFAVTYLIDFMY